MDIKKLKKELLDLKLVYLDQLDLSKKFQFGCEVEMAGVSKDKMEDLFSFYQTILCANDHRYHIDKEVHDCIELVTPILKDKKRDWVSFNQMLGFFKENGAYLNEYTAGHIHVGTNGLDTMKKLSLLLKSLVVFLPVLFRFGYGTFRDPRITLIAHRNVYNSAMMPPKRQLVELVTVLDQENLSKLKIAFLLFKRANYARPAFNFYPFDIEKIITGQKKENDHIEFRHFDGSLHSIIWQNNVHFLGKFLEKIENEQMDIEYIEREFEIYKKEFQYENYDPLNRDIPVLEKQLAQYNKYLAKINEEDCDKALHLADMIYDNELDKLYFLKQYFKTFKNPEIKHEMMVKAML